MIKPTGFHSFFKALRVIVLQKMKEKTEKGNTQREITM